MKASKTSTDGPAAGQSYDAQQANWNSTAAPPAAFGSAVNTWNSQQQQMQQQPGGGYGTSQQQQYNSNGEQQYGGTPAAPPGGYQQSGPGFGNDLPPGVDAPNCDCGEPAVFRTSNSERNPGRQFFGCGKRMDDPSKCRYFCWLDQLGKTPAARPPRTSTGGTGTGYTGVVHSGMPADSWCCRIRYCVICIILHKNCSIIAGVHHDNTRYVALAQML